MGKNNIYKSLLIYFFIIALLISCDVGKNINLINPDIKIKKINLDPDGNFTLDDVLNSYDTNDVMGFIQLNNDYERIFFYDNPTISINLNQNSAQAYFFNSDTMDIIYPCNGIYINNYVLSNAGSGTYTYIGYGNQDNQNSLYYNFSSSNSIEIIGNQYIPSIDTSINFGSPIRILNVNRGATISTLNSLNISWSGESQCFAQIIIFNSDSLAEYSDTSLYEGSAIVENDGSFTISSNVMSQFRDGIYNICLTKFEPYFILFNNGKKSLIILKSSHKITVYLSSN
ncbi:hypothetical protein D9V86_03020 [Bacteroidetes/Chlorobi group bacterium ChocPot_Mid]|nr:MAG: hypothetical protein D9V86_03020 [Bacteroidetes/Chlorobi group bacterium ChocPot_Mid]